MINFWPCVLASFYHLGNLLCDSRSILSTRTCVETAAPPASAAGGRGACDVITTGRRRRRSVALRVRCRCRRLLRQSGSQQPAYFSWLSARVGSRGDGRRSGRLVVGEPAGRRQQPRYRSPARPPSTLPGPRLSPLPARGSRRGPPGGGARS